MPLLGLNDSAKRLMNTWALSFSCMTGVAGALIRQLRDATFQRALIFLPNHMTGANYLSHPIISNIHSSRKKVFYVKVVAPAQGLVKAVTADGRSGTQHSLSIFKQKVLLLWLPGSNQTADESGLHLAWICSSSSDWRLEVSVICYSWLRLTTPHHVQIRRMFLILPALWSSSARLGLVWRTKQASLEEVLVTYLAI